MTVSHPYAESAWSYRKSGWRGVIPVGHRAGEKSPPPTAYTGWSGIDPSGPDIQEWVDHAGSRNIALHLPLGVYVLDVDHYGEKKGNSQLRELEEKLGLLPRTWVSTARDPLLSRQMFFRADLPAGRVWVDKPAPAIESLHVGHRYAVVWPSVNPDANGAMYRWYDMEGHSVDVVPRVEDFPWLPSAWVEELTKEGEVLEGSSQGWDEALAVLKAFPKGEACPRVSKALEGELQRIGRASSEALHKPGGLHPLVCYGIEGHAGVGRALRAHRDAHVAAREAKGSRLGLAEWQRMVAGSVGKKLFLTEGEVKTGCTCRSGEVVEDSNTDSVDFTDAKVAGIVAEKALRGLFMFTEGLGWLGWQRTHWHEVSPALVGEQVRQFMIRMQVDAIEADKQRVMKGEEVNGKEASGWRKYQGAGHLESVTRLARGIEGVYGLASDFDTDPDVLNTLSGVVNLKTGEIYEHDPKLLMTKVTGVKYVPGAESVHVKAALSAVPDDSVDWLQLMLGKAITGYSPDQLVLLTGGGSNGKTALMGAIFRTLGTYAAKVPNVLLLKGGNKGGATPEKMNLKGTRFAYMEETPEEGYLDAQVTKDLIDAEVIEGRALYKSTVTWTPTHSIFLNTNHPPTVTDTGDGTWRRLARVEFPFRYRKAGEVLEGENDRTGDPRLKANLRLVGAQEALLAWLVAGAHRSYAEGEVGLPASVAASVQKWREASDDVLRFLGERCEVAGIKDGVVTSELYNEYKEWALRNGHRPMSSRELFKRIAGHSALPRYVVMRQVRASGYTISRPFGGRAPWIVADGAVGVDPPKVADKPWLMLGLRFV